MNNMEKAVSLFKNGFRCSQAILSTYGPEFGLNADLALKMASPFGAGMGSMGKTCGAVTGAFMVLGLKHGNSKTDEIEKKEKVYEVINEFVKKFKLIHGTIRCKDLLHCDISTSEGRTKAIENQLFKELCPQFVRDSAKILEDLLQE